MLRRMSKVLQKPNTRTYILQRLLNDKPEDPRQVYSIASESDAEKENLCKIEEQLTQYEIFSQRNGENELVVVDNPPDDFAKLLSAFINKK